jgi:hypothetical protein
MPAVLTHDQFGRDALGDVSAVLGFATFDEHDAFMLGNQGPDPLFYLVADPLSDKATHEVGELMHHEHPSRLFASLHDAISMLPEQERHVGEAYAAGFLCHYLLDSTAHPLIFAQQYAICGAGVDGLDESDGSRVHAEIEKDLDEAVLYRRCGQTIDSFIPWKECLQASDETLAVIDKIYFYLVLWTYSQTIPLGLYTRAVKSFRRMQRLFWAPGLTKRRVMGAVEETFSTKRYSLYQAMAHRVRAEEVSDFDNREHRPWTDPFTGERRDESFWDLFDVARSRVGASIELLFDPQFDEAMARQLNGGVNFNGDPAHDEAGRVAQAPAEV